MFHSRPRHRTAFSFTPDGLQIARRRDRRRWLPLWHLIFFIYLVLLIRLMAMADLGPAGYAHRLEEMRGGTLLERGAAQVLRMDPVSRTLALQVRGGLAWTRNTLFGPR